MAWTFVAGRALRNGQLRFWLDQLHKNSGARRSAVDRLSGTVLMFTISATSAMAIVRLLLTRSVGGSLIRRLYRESIATVFLSADFNIDPVIEIPERWEIWS
jgi:hypothetical protein